jgi:threonine synthase
VTPLLERYADRLGVGPDTPVVSLGEGSTPLVPSRVIGPRLGVSLFFKWEGANPTGSYKDRGMTVAVSRAVGDGAEAIVCASTGNTAASAAAYAARAGIAAIVLHPAGAVSQPKLVQTRALGARVLQVRGSFDEALDAARDLGARGTHVLVNSLNPNRVEGQKTAVYELVEELGEAPDAIYIPYGGGGNTTAYTRGLREVGATSRLVSAQASDRTGTLASAIRIGNPAHAEFVAQSGAQVVSVDDDAIVDAWRELAVAEGIFCEPASAAGVAALAAAPRAGETVVCVLTGHGLKDLESVEQYAAPSITVDPDPDEIAAAAR